MLNRRFFFMLQQQQRSGHGGTRESSGYPSGPAEQDGWTRGAHMNQYPAVAAAPAEPMSLPASGRMGESGRSNSLVHDGRHSLLQFAMLHFRQSPEK
jgi:hypothetical protein